MKIHVSRFVAFLCFSCCLLTLSSHGLASTYTPGKLGILPADKFIYTPGMGWLAYVSVDPGPLCDLDDSQEGLSSKLNSLNDLENGKCNLLYIRVTWRFFEEFQTAFGCTGKEQIQSFLQKVHAYNATVEKSRQFRVLMRVMFTNSSDGNIRDYPVEYPAGSGRLVEPRTFQWETDVCVNKDPYGRPVICPTCSSDPMRELDYWDHEGYGIPTAIVEDWNSELADFATNPNCSGVFFGMEPGYPGDWGEFSPYNSFCTHPNEWETYTSTLDTWLTDFATKMKSRNLEIFISVNNWVAFDPNGPWPTSDENCAITYPPGATRNPCAELYQIIAHNGYTARKDTEFIRSDATTPEGTPFWWDNNNFCLWSGYAIQRLTEYAREGNPWLLEYDANYQAGYQSPAVNPWDEISTHVNYMELGPTTVGSSPWGLAKAIEGLSDSVQTEYKNWIGYRFQVDHIDYTPDQSFQVFIRNIAKGFCANKIRLVLFKNGAALAVAEQTADVVRHLRTNDQETLSIPFSWPTGINPQDQFSLGLEVFDKTRTVGDQWVPVKWANTNPGAAGNEPVYQLSLPFFPQCQYSVTPAQLNIASAGGTLSVQLSTSSGCPWAITETPDVAWISQVTPTQGSGACTIYFSVSASTGSTPRTGHFSISGQRITVVQAGATACQYTVTPGSPNVPWNGGTFTVQVNTSSGCAWTAANPDVGWITQISPSQGSGNGTVSFSIDANNGNTVRTGHFSIADQVVTVNQAKNSPCTLAVSPDLLTFTTRGGIATIAIVTEVGCSWTITKKASWLNVSTLSGTGSRTVTISASPTRYARSTSLRISCGSQVVNVEIEQAGR